MEYFGVFNAQDEIIDIFENPIEAGAFAGELLDYEGGRTISIVRLTESMKKELEEGGWDE